MISAALHQVKIPASPTLMAKSFAQMRLVAAELDPSLDPFAVARAYLLRSAAEQLGRSLDLQQAFYEVQKARLPVGQAQATIAPLDQAQHVHAAWLMPARNRAGERRHAVAAEPPTRTVEKAETIHKGEPKGRSAWWRTILTGVLLYVVGLVLLVLSGNPNLFPTVVMIGSFTVPAAYVAFFYQRRHLSRLTFANVVSSFFWGGVLGVFAATILEPIFVSGNGDGIGLGTAFQVGLIEEAVKVLGVLWIARTIRHNSELDGLIIGAAAGMGFASLESMGYAFTAFLGSQGSLSAIVGVTLLRGLLSPLGHGTWTAILAGVLFRQSGESRFHVDRAVIGAFATVVVLHALWDGLPNLLASFMTSGLDIFLAQVAVGLVGLIILWSRWREAVRVHHARLAAETMPVAAPAMVDGGQDGQAADRHDEAA